MPALNDKHHLLRTFCTVVHFSSFSKASTFLGLPVSSVSKHIKQLEEQLKTQLIVRNTRSMNLTDAGTLYYEKGSKILKKVDELEQEIQSLTQNSEGKLRISLPLMIGERVLSPLITEFVNEHPDITLELDFSHKPTDLIEQGFDIAFRTASSLPDSSLFEIKLLELQPVYVAAPDYLSRCGRPTKLSDLINHSRLVFQANIGAQGTHGVFEESGQGGSKVVSNSYQSLISAARSGCGITCVYDILVKKELEDNALVEILKAQQPKKKYLSILYRQRGNTSKKIHAFIEFFRHHPAFKNKR